MPRPQPPGKNNDWALEHIERLIDDLESEPEGRELLPDGLLDIWAPIQEAVRRLRR